NSFIDQALLAEIKKQTHSNAAEFQVAQNLGVVFSSKNPAQHLQFTDEPLRHQEIAFEKVYRLLPMHQLSAGLRQHSQTVSPRPFAKSCLSLCFICVPSRICWVPYFSNTSVTPSLVTTSRSFSTTALASNLLPPSVRARLKCVSLPGSVFHVP